MAHDDTKRSSLDGVKRPRAEGRTRATPTGAPEVEPDDDFWRNARIVAAATGTRSARHREVAS